MTAARVSDPTRLAKRLTEPSPSTAAVQVGQVTAVDPTSGAVSVAVRGIAVSAVVFAAVPVQVGDSVLIVQQDGVCYVVAPLSGVQAAPLSGVVAGVPANSSQLLVTVPAGTLSAGYLASYTSPTVGDAVTLAWLGSTPVVLGKTGVTGAPPPPTPPTPPAPKPAPPTPPTVGTSTFPAVAVGTYRSGDGWRDDANGDVIQGTAPGYGGANNGVWFYGGRIAASLRGATVTSCAIYLGRTQGGLYAAQAAHIQRVAADTQPAGNVGYTGSATDVALAVGAAGWYALPPSLGQALVDTGGSLGVSGAPYMRLYGLSKSGQAGSLRLGYRR